MGKKKLFLLSLLFLPMLGRGEEWCKANDYRITPEWKLPEIMGKDFQVILQHVKEWKQTPPADELKKLHPFIPLPMAKVPPEIRKYMDVPAFTDTAINLPYIDASDVKRGADGSLSFAPLTMPEPVIDGRVFLVSPQRLVRKYLKVDLWSYFFGNYKFDAKEWQKWKAAHPNYAGTAGLIEWGNECRHFHSLIKRWETINPKKYKFTPEEWQEIYKKFPVDNELPTRRDYVEKRLKLYYDRAKEICFNDASGVYAFDGMWNFGHLAAYWGSKLIGIETSRTYTEWQFQMMCCRGAARQFNIPWAWYIASFVTSPNRQGKIINSAMATADRPYYGMSDSAVKRVYYLTYLSGTNLMEREGIGRIYWNRTKPYPENWAPSEEAKMYFQFYDFTKKNPDRGVPYTPVALLAPYDRGLSRMIIRPFGLYDYTPADNLIDAIRTLIMPCGSSYAMKRKGIEMTLRNGPYGDVFDVLTPDFADQTSFRRIIGSYKAAILTGEYAKNPEMVSILKEFVKNGGTLVLNSAQLATGFDSAFTGVELTGSTRYDGSHIYADMKLMKHAVPLMKDEKGHVVFSKNQYGKGQVIVASPQHLVPEFDPNDENLNGYVLSQTLNEERKFPYVKIMLDSIVPGLLPAKVKGDVQYGFNKTKTGWWIYLFNNKGIMKYPDEKPTYDSKYTADVTLELTGMSARKVTELCSGKAIAINGKTCKITIAPGDFAILKIEE